MFVRGNVDHQPIEHYLDGLRAIGVSHVEGKVVSGSGEIISLEKPAELVTILAGFALPP